MRLLLFFLLFSSSVFQIKSQQLPELYNDYLNRVKYEPIDSLIAEIERKEQNSENIALLGELYLFKGRNDLSIKHLDKALQDLNNDNNKTEVYCRTLSNKGIVLWNEGKAEQALNYMLEALSIRRKNKDLSPTILADNYNNLGLVLSNEDDIAAKDYYYKALDIYSEHPEDNLDKIIQSTINLSLIESRNKEFKNSLILLNSALEKWKQNHSTPTPTEAFILVNIANIYLETSNFVLAEDNFKDAVEIYLKTYGERNAEIANVFMLMGDLYKTQNDFKTALYYNQKALISNSFKFSSSLVTQHPTIEDAIKPYNQLIILIRKANIYESYYYKYSLKKEHLLSALNTLAACDTLIQELRISRTNKKDQLALSDLAAEVYQDAQRICFRLSEVTLFPNSYDGQALNYAEKAKGISLLSALVESEAKTFAKIPIELTEAENKLNNEIAFLTTQLSLTGASELKEGYRSTLFEAKNKYDQLVSRIENEYPEYYKLKHNSQVANLSTIQNLLLRDQAILNYAVDFEADEIYLYFITKEKLKLFTIKNANDIKRYLRAYKNTIIYDLKNEFDQISYELYKRLIPFKIPNEINNLSIIPDGELAKVPFEAFLTDRTRTNDDIDNQNYLLKKYKINYGFSITLHLDKKEKSFQNSAVLVAPIGFKSNLLPDLPATQTEINDLTAVFSKNNINTKQLVQVDATEDNFKNYALDQYKYIHLATHGIVNVETPELSGVFFSDKDNTEDGILYTSEIYSLSINADLVTLSACETGLGEIKRGEGIIGLGSAFTYAGASNLLVSVWKVPDTSTASLMSQFYNHSIDDSQSYAAGLREAKLKLINSEFSSPYYWASFMLWGN